MANVFYMPCERDNGIERVYHSRCPLWCEDHLPTQSFEIDFDDFTDDNGDIAETDTVVDSLGITWGFGGTDPEWTVGAKDFDPPCPNSVWFDQNATSTGGPLQLRPQLSAAGNAHPHPPHFNRHYPWTIIWEGVSASAGELAWNASSGPSFGDGLDCGQRTSSTILGDVPGANMQFSEDMSNLCDINEQGLITPRIGADHGLTQCCVCYMLRVDPCEHRIDKVVRITHDGTFDQSCETYWQQNSTRVGADDQEKRFSLSCDDWWITDPNDPFSRGFYQPDDSDNPAAISPPNLMGMYHREQEMVFNFGTPGPGANTGFFVRRFRLIDGFLSDSDFESSCPAVVR